MKKFTKVLTASLTLAMVMTGCSAPAEEAKDASYKAGTYTYTAKGLNGDVVVDVTLTESKIEKIEVKEHSETAGLGDTAMETVSKAIIEAQKAEVDVVAGATYSSNAVIDAVKDAINQATK